MNNFDESKHKRDHIGRFAKSSDGAGGSHEATEAERRRLHEMGITVGGDSKEKKALTKKVVKVDMDADIQKQLNAANTPKERQKIAYRYIMDNLCGKYATRDGRTVTISSVGADKITHRDIEIKLRVSPHLADFIKAGELENVKEVEHRKFAKFAYYKVSFQLGNDTYTGLLNIGIRSDGSSTLYDLNPFNKH